MSQHYLNRQSILFMTYYPSDCSPVQIVRIWRSNYHLQHFRQPIWLGSVHPHALRTMKQPQNALLNRKKPKSIVYVSSALPTYLLRRINLPSRVSKQALSAEVEPVLLLIKEPPNNNSDFIESEEHTSELQSLMRISYAVFCLKKKTQINYVL